jgi:hypothetical protein
VVQVAWEELQTLTRVEMPLMEVWTKTPEKVSCSSEEAKTAREEVQAQGEKEKRTWEPLSFGEAQD